MEIKEYILGDIFRDKPEYGCSSPSLDKGNIKYLTQSDLDKSYDEINKWITIDDNNSKKYMLKKGDFLMSRAGTIKSYFYSENKPMIFAGYLVRYAFNENILMSQYFYYWTKSFYGSKIINNISNTGTTMPKLNPPIFSKIKIKIPSIYIQQKIINIIEPKEKLFIKYNKIIDITNIEKFKKSWSNLINIIEPFERLKLNIKNKLFNLHSIFNSTHDNHHDKFIALKNISQIVTGKKNADFSTLNGKYRFFTCSINKIQHCDAYEYDDEVILLAGNGDIGEIKYFNGKFDAYQRTYIIKSSLLGNVFYSLQNKKNYFVKNSNGSVVKFLTLSTINEILINTNIKINGIRHKILVLIFKYECIEIIIDKILNKLIEYLIS